MTQPAAKAVNTRRDCRCTVCSDATCITPSSHTGTLNCGCAMHCQVISLSSFAGAYVLCRGTARELSYLYNTSLPISLHPFGMCSIGPVVIVLPSGPATTSYATHQPTCALDTCTIKCHLSCHNRSHSTRHKANAMTRSKN